MNKFGKWSFFLAMISLVLFIAFALLLTTGYALQLSPSTTSAVGTIAVVVLVASVIVSLVSLAKGETGKWKLAPWLLIGASVLVLVILLNVVWMSG